jgi:monoamine oxidase
MFYDIIIIGGGIAGIYTAYKIQKHSPDKKILILEKEKYLGGRILTFHNKYMSVEAGAGRFSDSHTYLLELLYELKLSKKINKITTEAVLDSPTIPQNNIVNELIDPIFYRGLDITLGRRNIPSSGFITKVIISSKFESNTYLQNMSFLEYAAKVLEKEEVEYIKQTFGYYSELIIMNAYDAIKLMGGLGSFNQFYNLKGGFSQIIDTMVDEIKKNPNIKVLLNKEVKQIKPIFGEMGGSGFEINKLYYSKKCICTLPKNTVEKISIFKEIKPLLKGIECGSLCRIYCKFDKDPDGDVWFKNLPKMTTNNNLRMIIPWNEKEGIIMISYTDNIFADYWKKLYDSKGIKEVNKKLRENVEECIGRKIPQPKHTQLFYWKCGVGYWGIGADSYEISKAIIKPYDNLDLFICGENYSHSFQQWIEGSLETSNRVLKYFL